jgi:hypothetical protein
MKSARCTPAPGKTSLPGLLAVLAASGAAACAAIDSELTAARESWRGATYEQVVAAWGPPARSTQSSHTWISEDREAQRSGGGVGGVLFTSPSDAAARCERTLVVQDARVVRAGDWIGERSFCTRFARGK